MLSGSSSTFQTTSRCGTGQYFIVLAGSGPDPVEFLADDGSSETKQTVHIFFLEAPAARLDTYGVGEFCNHIRVYGQFVF